MTDQTFPKELYVRIDSSDDERYFYADTRLMDVVRGSDEDVALVATYKLENVKSLKLVVTEKVETVEGENV